MTRPIIVIRPEPGCTATLAASARRGLEMEGWPLFVVRARSWQPPSPVSFDGLLLGSANALRHGGPGLAACLHLPVYAVGEATAEAARAAGFGVAATGTGGLQGMLDRARDLPRRLLRLAGAEHVPLVPPPGVTIATCITYETVPLPLPAALAEKLAGGALVLLHSAAAARHFAAECDRLGLTRGRIALAVLGPRIAHAAGDGWHLLHSAGCPDDAALLALAADLCHELRNTTT